MEPETQYARHGNQRIAYQVLGTGPVDIVITPGRMSSMDAEWDDPATALFYQRVASFCRLIRYDARGTGSSDPVALDALPPLESSVDELWAVMDAAGSERAVVLGGLDGGPVALLAAVTRPARVLGLVLVHAPARFTQAPDYPIGIVPEVAEMMRQAIQASGPEDLFLMSAPSQAADPTFVRRIQRHIRSVAGPSAMGAYFVEMLERDVRSLLPAVQVPTLVLHRANNAILPVELSRYLADTIKGARLVLIDGADLWPFYENPDQFIAAIRVFLMGLSTESAAVLSMDRVMATVLFTDIVDSTERAQTAGDAEWRHLLEMHDSLSRRLVGEYLGKVVKTTGDGIMARFDSPGRGILSAAALRDQLGRVGLPIRAGLHTGEVELRAEDLGGVGVHIAARVMAVAEPGEVLVSRTVRDLVVGSEFHFEDRGSHHLKGVEGDWQLFALAGS